MAKSGKTLRDLFHDTLKDIYFAEKKILTTLPKMAKVARSEDLIAAFDKHRRRPFGGRAGCRALRNLPLRHAQGLGREARHDGSCGAFGRDAGGREGNR